MRLGFDWFFFVNDHVSSYCLHSFNCEVNAIYIFLIQRQS